ncbi:phosphoribosylformylglycinamidine cyclo-ligase [Eubacterium sp.]|uniref:phosphoribosylformylglycinamidine cyclo-ligase n=1 Tax=Eubacterium sp. TaxID=142586 RepID=UPI0025ED1D5C|nr:phosphoribosylformylglycinamidine cyclo-ligase [Eubacterium sp.]MDD7331825.1 phosphoribosylformylglycinamidine cyclo-ligase [Eubacterium sp.]MDY3812518.1 phosphoribosylformylglycinamidine cyclo-ligase [Eubacterium sp.]
MEKSFSDSYAAAGVDVTAGYESVELIKSHVKRTNIPGVIGGIGGFGGMFELASAQYKNPVLVSGTDGVGTKIKLAFLMDKHDTIGIDCVAMCVNDVACSGAKPLFFLDYIACGKNYPEKIEQIVKGVADGCVMSGCALVGGETAEHPGMMPNEEYDLAGFTVGIGEKDKLVSGEHLKAGDAIIGVASSGVHSNGFSLVRKVFDINEKTIDVYYDELGAKLGETLLTPTRIYVKPLLALMDEVRLNAISHITGGGFYENVPRMLNDNTLAVIEKDKCFKLPIFDLIQKTGNIPERDMYNTFNMGTGLMLCVDSDKADEAVRILNANGEQAAVIGEIKNGQKGVEIC